MPLEFSMITPLLTHLLETSSEVLVFLNEINVESYLTIPQVPTLRCDAAIAVVTSLADVEALFGPARRGYFNIHTLSANSDQYSFSFIFLTRLGSIEASEEVRNKFAPLLAFIPESELRAID